MQYEYPLELSLKLASVRTTPLISDAVSLAEESHAGQVDKAGKPYIAHPMRVAEKMGSEEEVIVAWLHDSLEDSDKVSEEKLRWFFGDKVADAIVLLTRTPYGEEPAMTYMDYIHKIAASPLARKVKLADLEDNMDLSRYGPCIPSGAIALVESRYKPAYEFLQSCAD